MSSTSTPSIDRLRVRPHADGWALFVEDIPTPAWVVSSRKRAVAAAKDAAEDLEARLRVLDASGRITGEHDHMS